MKTAVCVTGDCGWVKNTKQKISWESDVATVSPHIEPVSRHFHTYIFSKVSCNDWCHDSRNGRECVADSQKNPCIPAEERSEQSCSLILPFGWDRFIVSLYIIDFSGSLGLKCMDVTTHRGAMSIWLMKTPEALAPAMVVESVRKVTVRMWLQPA